MKFLYRLKQILLLFGDILLFILSLFLSLGLRNLELPETSKLQENLSVFFYIFPLWLILNYINGLYDFKKISQKKSIKTLLQTALTSFLLSIAIFYVFPFPNVAPKTILIFTVIISYTLIFIWRKIYLTIISSTKLKNNLLFLEYNKEVDEMINILNKQKHLGFEIKAVIDETNTLQDTNNLKIYNSLDDLEKIVAENNIHIIVTDSNFQKDEKYVQELYKLLFKQIKIFNISNFYENITGRIPPSVFNKSWFLQNLSEIDKPIYNKFIRLLDIVTIFIFSIFFVIFLPLIALAIKSTSKGKIFFKQQRLGKNGQVFWIYKFRTMYSLAKDGSAEMNGAEFAQKNDKRVTSIGKFLRKTRLDELPQIINLIKGEITLIGPRPERPEICNNLQAEMPYYNLRHILKPGITGWAQVQQNYTDNLETSIQKFQYDLFYIKNRSIFLDLSILLKTVNVILRAMGQ
ncbi:MAG: exopolysaccharide biosynthesis polyprenyl glycosylphosphotransferase [Candidatus Magasanikbacteria bacterium]